MVNSPLRAYLKSIINFILYRKIRDDDFYFVLAIILYMYVITISTILFAHGLISYKTSNWVDGIALCFYLLCIIIFIVIYHYHYFKEYEYNRIKIPEKIKEIKSEVSPDIWLIIKNLEERISSIEKNLSPFRLTLYGIFLAVTLAIAIPMIFLLLPKIISPR